MYYHFCLLCAFRPFIGLVLEDSDIQPHEMCTQAAQSILALAQSYDDLFTLRRVSGLVPYFVCASGLFILAMEDSGSRMDPVHLRLVDDTRSISGAESKEHESAARRYGASVIPSHIKMSAAAHAGLLLEKMGSTHPAAVIAGRMLQEEIGRNQGE